MGEAHRPHIPGAWRAQYSITETTLTMLSFGCQTEVQQLQIRCFWQCTYWPWHWLIGDGVAGGNVQRGHRLAGKEWREGDKRTEYLLVLVSSRHPEDSCLNSTPLDTTETNMGKE